MAILLVRNLELSCIFHHKGIAFFAYLAGIYLNNELLQLTVIILFGHPSMDRILGYGLKYDGSFNKPNLGIIGNINKS